jgi:monoamine oxidase
MRPIPDIASLKSIVSEWSGGASIESEQARPVGGYGGMVDYMLHRIDPTLVRIRRSTPVQHVLWSAAGAELTVSAEASQAFEASAVIITVPLGVLSAPTSTSIHHSRRRPRLSQGWRWVRCTA